MVPPTDDTTLTRRSVVNSGLIAGAIDHAVERMIVDGVGTIARMPVRTASAGRVFERASEEGIATIVVRPGEQLPASAVTGSARTLADPALAAGRIVVLRERPVEVDGVSRIGWSEVDPATGVTFDRMDDGGRDAVADWMLIAKFLGPASCAMWGLGTVAMIGFASAEQILLTVGATHVANQGGAICVALL